MRKDVNNFFNKSFCSKNLVYLKQKVLKVYNYLFNRYCILINEKVSKLCR